ncbi:transducin/WD40 repeat-like superfamily protein [Tanacetum coccineum]
MTSHVVVAAALAVWYPSLVKPSLAMLCVHPLLKLVVAMNDKYSSIAAEILAEGMESTCSLCIASEIPRIISDIFLQIKHVNGASAKPSHGSDTFVEIRASLVDLLLPSLAMADVPAFLHVIERQIWLTASDSPAHIVSLMTLIRVTRSSPRNLAPYLDKVSCLSIFGYEGEFAARESMVYGGGNAAQERYGNASGQYVGGYLLLEDVAEYQMPLLCEIEICLKKKCDKLADAFIDDLGLPRGLKFNPFDSEIIWHLLAKSGVSGFQPHAFIDEFIPTVAKEDGISYTHPQKSPTSTVTEHVNISVVDSLYKRGWDTSYGGFTKQTKMPGSTLTELKHVEIKESLDTVFSPAALAVLGTGTSFKAANGKSESDSYYLSLDSS